VDPLEIVAVSLGLCNVVLVVRRSVWNYPFALAMVSIYAWIFSRPDVRLYSDALLQIFFFVVNLYGWRHWSRTRAAEGEVTVRRLSSRSRLLVPLGIGVATLVWGSGMARFTDASLPFADAFIAMASVAAQILLARRFVDNWPIWVAIDVVAIAVYASKNLPLTALLYGVFLGLSVWGWIGWQRTIKTQA
jgi:nicotinamide mononucleotide transporter